MTVEKLGNGDECRVIEWGEYLAFYQRLPAGTEGRAGDGSSECPRWGYVVSGKLRFVYQDGSEAVVSAGEVYYAMFDRGIASKHSRAAGAFESRELVVRAA